MARTQLFMRYARVDTNVLLVHSKMQGTPMNLRLISCGNLYLLQYRQNLDISKNGVTYPQMISKSLYRWGLLEQH